jgi:hypothetical protein
VKDSLRERVRCSSLVDWPVYPRLIREYVGGLAVAQLSALGAGRLGDVARTPSYGCATGAWFRANAVQRPQGDSAKASE